MRPPLTLDPRAGSGDLAAPLRQLEIPVKVEELAFGDVQIIGRGPEGRDVLVGVELKRLHELLAESERDRFLGHQLPGLVQYYELPMLLIEGMFSGDEQGMLIEQRAGRWRAPEGRQWPYIGFAGFLNTLQMRAGVPWFNVPDRRSTALWLAELWRWWNVKGYEAHTSHQVVREKDLDPEPWENYWATRKMKVVSALVDGIGVKKAREAGKHFPSIREMINAPEAEWREIDGIGKVLAKKLVEEIERRDA